MNVWTGPRSWAAISLAFASLTSGTAHAISALPGNIQAEDFDGGGEAAGYHDTTLGNSGGQYRTNYDVDIIRTADSWGGYDVNRFATGEWLAYTVTVAEGGAFDFSLRVATTYSDSAFHIEVDGQNVTGRVAVARTGGWSRYRWANAPRITLTAGQHLVKVVADRQYFNLNVVRALRAPVSSPYSGTPTRLPGQFEAEDYDLGGEGVAYHDVVAGNAGGQYRLYEDVDIVPSNDSAGGLYDVNNFQTGEWLVYTVDVAAAGDYDLALRVASAFTDSAFRVEVDGRDVTGRVVVPSTGGWGSYQWVAGGRINLSAGQHAVKVIAAQQYFNLNRVRIVAPAAPPPPPPPPDPTNVLFLCTFATGPTNCGFQEQAKVSGRATIVSIARDGLTGVRLHTEPGDNNVTGSGEMERNDLWLTQAATDGYAGREQWWAHSFYLPSDFVIPGWHNYVFFDFHNTNTGPGQANFHVLNRNGVMTFQGYGGAASAANPFSAPIGPIQKGVWYDFVYHVKWSSGSDGYFDAWVNGVKKLSHRGPTMYSGQGVYLKLANYHVPVCDPYPACIGTHAPSSIIHDRVIRGTTPLSVSSGPLEGVLGLVNGVLTPIVP